MLVRIALGLAAALLAAGCTGCASAADPSAGDGFVRPSAANLPSAAAAAPRPVTPGVVFVPGRPRALDPEAFAEVSREGLVPRAVGLPLLEEHELPPIPGGGEAAPEGVTFVEEEWLEEEPCPDGAEDPACADDGWPEEEWIEVDEVWYADPVVVPGDTVHLGMPVLVVEGWSSRAYGRFPAICSAAAYDPCDWRPHGDYWNTAYDPCWDPCRDPAYRSWDSYGHEWVARHGEDFDRCTAPLAGDGETAVVVSRRAGMTELDRRGPDPGPPVGGGSPPAPPAPPPPPAPVAGGGGGGGASPARGPGAFGSPARRGADPAPAAAIGRSEGSPGFGGPREAPARTARAPSAPAFRSVAGVRTSAPRRGEEETAVDAAPERATFRRPAPAAPPVTGSRSAPPPHPGRRSPERERADPPTRRAAAAAPRPEPAPGPARIGGSPRRDPDPPTRRAEPAPERPSRPERQASAPRPDPPARAEPAPAPREEPPPPPQRRGGRGK